MKPWINTSTLAVNKQVLQEIIKLRIQQSQDFEKESQDSTTLEQNSWVDAIAGFTKKDAFFANFKVPTARWLK